MSECLRDAQSSTGASEAGNSRPMQSLSTSCDPKLECRLSGSVRDVRGRQLLADSTRRQKVREPVRCETTHPRRQSRTATLLSLI